MNVIHVLHGMRIVNGQPYIRGDAYVAELRALAEACRQLSAREPLPAQHATQPSRRLGLYVAHMLDSCADQADAELIGRLSAARARTSRAAAVHPPPWIRPALWLLAVSITGVALAEMHRHGLAPALIFHLGWLVTVITLATRPGWGPPPWKRAAETSDTATARTGTRTHA
ncbi:hypothetical protein ACWDA3_58275 [Nonomuraea rubra]